MTATALFDLDAAKATATRTIDAADARLRDLSLEIHSHPELGFEEHYAHDLLTGFLSGEGFEVELAAYGMPTAFRAIAGSGGPTVAVFCEYDALPEIGHACGHNLIAASGVAVGLALKAALPDGRGTIIVLGGPAEEGGGGKIFMLNRGALEGVDAAMMLHPAPGDSAWANLIAIEQIHVRYHGRNAHAGAAPWAGVNALDALVLAYSSISAMRQQMRPTDRVHGIITEGGIKPNIIPDVAAGEYYIRARNMAELAELRAKVVGCFEGAATSAGCTVDIETVGETYAEVVTNSAMANLYCDNMEQFELVLPRGGQGGIAGASTDMGNISQAVPSIHPTFGIPTEAVNHTPGFTASAATPEAHRRMLRASKALALTALDLYADPALLAAAKAEFASEA